MMTVGAGMCAEGVARCDELPQGQDSRFPQLSSDPMHGRSPVTIRSSSGMAERPFIPEERALS